MRIVGFFERNPILMVLLGVFGISLSSIFVKFSAAPSTVTAAFRLLWTVLLMTPIVFGKRVSRKELFSLPFNLFILSCISGFFLAVHFTFWFESLFQTSVASSTTIVCTEVIWVSFGYCLFLKGQLPRKAALFIGITFLGSVLIAFTDRASGSSHLYGDILALIAAIAVAVYVLIGRVVRERVSTTVYTYVVYVSCALFLCLFLFIQGTSLTGYGYGALIVGFLLAVFSTILGHSIFSWCLRYFSPSFVSASKLCEPVVAAVLAYFFFDEAPSMLQIIGGAVTLFGVFLYSKIELA